MKYKDYYAILGVERNADEETIKKAYRRLARKYHPDVSKEKDAEEKFKEVKEAYETLKDSEKRTAYDHLGQHRPGSDFEPPPGSWSNFEGFNEGQFNFEGIDLSDFLSGMYGRSGGRQSRRRSSTIPGQDYEVATHLTLEEANSGKEIELDLAVPEYDAQGFVRQVPKKFKARIPKGATNGQRLRLAGKGGKGFNGGQDGDLYLIITLHPHPLFRVDKHDLYIDLPISPWEAVLGTSIRVPTLSGAVQLKIPPGTRAGQQLKLSGRGLATRDGKAGDLFAIVQIVVPSVINEREQALFKQLAEISTFNPRGHFEQEIKNAS